MPMREVDLDIYESEFVVLLRLRNSVEWLERLVADTHEASVAAAVSSLRIARSASCTSRPR